MCIRDSKKAITIRKTQKKNPDDPLKNIMKNIQIHLNTEDAYEVNSLSLIHIFLSGVLEIP